MEDFFESQVFKRIVKFREQIDVFIPTYLYHKIGIVNGQHIIIPRPFAELALIKNVLRCSPVHLIQFLRHPEMFDRLPRSLLFYREMTNLVGELYLIDNDVLLNDQQDLEIRFRGGFRTRLYADQFGREDLEANWATFIVDQKINHGLLDDRFITVRAGHYRRYDFETATVVDVIPN